METKEKKIERYEPFRGISLLLNLCENAIGLVVDTVGARGKFAIALDFLLPTHIASLEGRKKKKTHKLATDIAISNCAGWYL